MNTTAPTAPVAIVAPHHEPRPNYIAGLRAVMASFAILARPAAAPAPKSFATRHRRRGRRSGRCWKSCCAG